MKGLIIWIIIIIISSIFKNLNKNKKQYEKNFELDKRKTLSKDQDMIKRVFEDFYYDEEDVKPINKNIDEKINDKSIQILPEEEKDDNNVPVSYFEEIDKGSREDDTIIADNIYQEKSVNTIHTDKYEDKNKKNEIQDIISSYENSKKRSINVKFTKNSIVNGIIMSEILGKPKKIR